MNKKIIMYTFLSVSLFILWWVISLVAGQYYYFDASSAPGYPYQQWCVENIYVKATTAANITWASAWLFSVQLDPIHFLYYTGDGAVDLQTNLFAANSSMFLSYTNPSLFPQWIDAGKTILHIDRSNTLSPFVGNRIYGTITNFIPKYTPTDYTWTFVIVYANDTTQTSLSYWWKNIINSWYQFAHLTWYYYVYQQPCVNDITPPAATLILPAAGTKQSYLSGITLTLLENVGDTTVPYVRTGDLPGVGIWTGNTWMINNQYGVDLSTFQLRISWNGTDKYFTGGVFSPSGPLAAIASDTTWQFRDKNYSITMSWSQLFDYGIEKTITITGSVRDRNNNITTFTRTFNAPVGPTLIAWSRNPYAWANGVLTTAPVILWIQDDWAGVNSWSIVIILSWVEWTPYGPYIYSWSSLHLSWVAGVANTPDYLTTISSHPNFPSSWTIKVIVSAQDMEWNFDTISDYTFSTKPSCADLGCCHEVSLQTGNTIPFVYNLFALNISGGINPTFTFDGNTGTINCGTENEGMDIYTWTESTSWTATYLSYYDLSKISFIGTDVTAVLSWNTLYFHKIYVPPIPIPPVVIGWGGWGGTHVTIDDCMLPSTLACANDAGTDDSPSYYDETCCGDGHWAAPSCDISDSPYSNEINDAFLWAYGLNITNKCPIAEARLDDGIKRKELAKMMTMFTIQVMGIYPDTNKTWCNFFSDLTGQSDEFKFFIKTSCQLDLMGLKPNGTVPEEKFNPERYVTRAEFGTVLSRLIYGDKHNVYSGEETTYKRYEKHLAALNKDNIMKKIQNPSVLEKRARVILMLDRTTSTNLIEKYRLIVAAHNAALSLLENIR